MPARTAAVVMDPIGSIRPEKDTTLALMLAAQRREWTLLYLEAGDLWLRDGSAYGHARPLRVADDPDAWYELGEPQLVPLGDLDVILMRKDPPFDMDYVTSTYMLDRAEASGALVVNRPQALRDCNEKVFLARFPQCAPATLVTSRIADLRAFRDEHVDIVVKPLDGMGGAGVFRVRPGDLNASVIFETVTAGGRRPCMAQPYLPAIEQGDKRILMIDGEPVGHVLARIPRAGELRGNLAAGGRGVTQPLSDRDRWIAAEVGPVLRDLGIVFAGLDVIGEHLTEINVTSPTCVREISRDTGEDIADRILEAIERRCN